MHSISFDIKENKKQPLLEQCNAIQNVHVIKVKPLEVTTQNSKI